MLSLRTLGAASRLAMRRAPPMRLLPQHFQMVRTYADTIVKVPTMAESISEGTLKQFNKQIGDYVEQDEEIATIETDKIDVAVNAPEAGTIKEFLVNEEDTVTVGQDLVRLELGGAPAEGSEKPAPKEESKSEPTPEKKQPEPESKPEPKKEESKPAPAAEKPAPKESKPAAPSKEATSSSSGPGSFSREVEKAKLTRIRLRTAERLKQSQNTAAFLSTFNIIDMSGLIEFRNKYKDEVLKNTGVKLGFMSAFARASVLAMRDFPAVGAWIEDEYSVQPKYVDISVAVATEKGLVTPVVRNVESLDMVGIDKAIAEAGKKARDGKLTIEDMTGGTFTISNGGIFGSLLSTPIINLPQTAVLGLHAINDAAVVVNKQIVVRPVMYVALTYDHRLLDGREAASFLFKVKQYIEDPARMLL